MTRRVALLRAINLAGRNKVPMPALRELCLALEMTEVATHVHTGNIVFVDPPVPLEARTLQGAIAEHFGVDTTVALRDASAIERLVVRDPFPTVDRGALHVGFFATQPTEERLEALRATGDATAAPERFWVDGEDVYLVLPNMARAKLPALLERRLKVPITYRNWNTVLAIAALVRD